MTPYYDDGQCRCGCGAGVGAGRQFVSGHNLKVLKRTPEHGAAIAAAQRKAWSEKRARLPIGTTRRNSHGYVLVKTRAGKGRWDKEHILVMEAEIKRRLFPGEVVHHINGVHDDNRPSNLHLFLTQSAHAHAHTSYDRLLAGLLADGIVRFNPKSGEYERR